MIINQHPGEIHTIYNPCIIKATKGAEDKAKLFIAIGIYTEIPGTFITVEHEYFNNEAYFDLKTTLKNNISSGIIDIIGSPCWIDKQFFVEYTVFDNLNVIVYSATAVNGVVQVQESSNLTDKRGHFMTKFDRLKRYDGYPLEIIAFAFRTGDTFIRFDGENFAQVEANVFVLPITDVHTSVEIGNQSYDAFLRDNQGRIITDNNLEPITVPVNQDYRQFIMPIDNPIMVENPFYVRWINQQGGWDYWMFGYRQYADRSITNQQTFNPYVQDQQAVKGFTDQVWIDGIEKVKVGASGMNQNEFDCVSRIIYSPEIEWFNEVTQSWQKIIIDGDGKNEDDTHDILGEVELTFTLPNPQLQF